MKTKTKDEELLWKCTNKECGNYDRLYKQQRKGRDYVPHPACCPYCQRRNVLVNFLKK